MKGMSCMDFDVWACFYDGMRRVVYQEVNSACAADVPISFERAWGDRARVPTPSHLRLSSCHCSRVQNLAEIDTIPCSFNLSHVEFSKMLPHSHTAACAENCPHTTPSPYAQTLDELSFERSLHGSANAGDLARVEKLLSKNTFVDERDYAGYTALVCIECSKSARRVWLDFFSANVALCFTPRSRRDMPSASERRRGCECHDKSFKSHSRWRWRSLGLVPYALTFMPISRFIGRFCRKVCPPFSCYSQVELW